MKGMYKRNDGDEEIAVSLDDIVVWLKNAIANNQITAEDVMKAIGFENKLRNATDDQRAELAKAITAALDLPEGTPPEELLKAVKEAFDEVEAAAETVVEATANELAGGKKLKNADGKEEDNPVFLYALKNLKGKRGKQLNSAVEALKSDPIMTSLRSKQADTRVNAKDSDPQVDKPSGIREV